MGIDDENVLTEFEEAEVRDPIPCKVDGDRVIYTSRQLRVRGSAGRPVLCDFGEARIGDGKFTEDIQPFQYRAPEVILQKPWDKKVDIWNLGVLASIFISLNLTSIPLRLVTKPLISSRYGISLRINIYSMLKTPTMKPPTQCILPK